MQNVADGRRLNNVTFSITSETNNGQVDVENVPKGEIIFVTASAPADQNTFIPFGFFQGRIISAQAAMAKE